MSGHGNRLTQAQVGELLGCGRNKVAALTRAGTLPTFPDPETGRPVYLRTTIEAWMRRRGELHAEHQHAGKD